MNLVTSGGFKPGEVVIYSGGRGGGKSIYNNNLCKEIMMQSLNGMKVSQWMMDAQKDQSKYKFSRKWHVAEFDLKDYDAVLEWCAEQFGPHPQNPDAWSRWYFQSVWGETIHFRDDRDYVLFILRWA